MKINPKDLERINACTGPWFQAAARVINTLAEPTLRLQKSREKVLQRLCSEHAGDAAPYHSSAYDLNQRMKDMVEKMPFAPSSADLDQQDRALGPGLIQFVPPSYKGPTITVCPVCHQEPDATTRAAFAEGHVADLKLQLQDHRATIARQGKTLLEQMDRADADEADLVLSKDAAYMKELNAMAERDKAKIKELEEGHQAFLRSSHEAFDHIHKALGSRPGEDIEVRAKEVMARLEAAEAKFNYIHGQSVTNLMEEKKSLEAQVRELTTRLEIQIEASRVANEVNNNAQARAQESETLVRRWESTMAAFLGCGYDTPKAAGLRIDKLLMRESELADVTEELGQLRTFKAAIDAAREGEPPEPAPVKNGEATTEEIIRIYFVKVRDLRAWGRQGWDAAAALRVEVANLKRVLLGKAAETEQAIANLLARLTRYQQAEGEVEPVPESKLFNGWRIEAGVLFDYATRLRDRLVGALAELADMRRAATERNREQLAQAREGGIRQERERIIALLDQDTNKGGHPNAAIVPDWVHNSDFPIGSAIFGEELRAFLTPEPAPSPCADDCTHPDHRHEATP